MPQDSDNPGSVPPVSRRGLLKSAAGLGVAAAIAGVGIARADSPGTHRTGAPDDLAPNAVPAAYGTAPVVVHLVDASAGALEVYATGTRRDVRDTALAARIARVGGTGPVVVHLVDPASGVLDVYGAGTRREVRDPALARRITAI